MAKKKTNKWGKWAFIVGVILALLAGLFPGALDVGSVALILVVLGLVVGLLNIQEKEAVNFLVATIALMAVGSAGVEVIGLFGLGSYLEQVVTNIALFVAPAAAVVSLKLVYDLAKD
ncbi:MAG: hypothetical protein GF368_03675 [Candidatus Aenigmarchaeota archaeon]|nr:hypothetical protein [Candidatus Aenigmarchaeota archaeon]